MLEALTIRRDEQMLTAQIAAHHGLRHIGPRMAERLVGSLALREESVI